MAFLLIFALILVGFFVFWFLTEVFFKSSFPPPAQLRNKCILLLIGHPDDEAMFFGPSLLALTAREHGNHVQILCLSTGNAVGQGEIRRGELLDSARRLGIRRRDDVHVVDDARFQDGPGTDWKKEDIADFLAQQLTTTKSTSSTAASGSPSHEATATIAITATDAPIAMPDVILTFDPDGVSLHPNHSACHAGATYFLRHHQHRLPKAPALYTLTSLPTPRKYIHVLDALITFLATTLSTSSPPSNTRCSKSSDDNNNSNSENNEPAIFVSNLPAYARAFGAMVNAHKTQMLWFRWGWIIFGRYMVVNDVRREVVVSDHTPNPGCAAATAAAAATGLGIGENSMR